MIDGKDATVPLFSSPIRCFPFRKTSAVCTNGQLRARTPRRGLPHAGGHAERGQPRSAEEGARASRCRWGPFHRAANMPGGVTRTTVGILGQLCHAARTTSNLRGPKWQRVDAHRHRSETRGNRAVTVVNFCHHDHGRAAGGPGLEVTHALPLTTHGPALAAWLCPPLDSEA